VAPEANAEDGEGQAPVAAAAAAVCGADDGGGDQEGDAALTESDLERGGKPERLRADGDMDEEASPEGLNTSH
jgi:hypothetical protein